LDNQDNDFDKIESAAADRRQQQNFDDLQNELSGNEVGRMGRFLSSEARDKLIAQKQGRPTKAMSALEMALLENRVYAAAYKFAVDETQAAQHEVQAFQDEVDAALTTLKAEIKDMLDEAVTLPDGRKAFMYANGQAWTTDGELVDEAIAAGIDWAGTPPGERYQELLEHQEKLEQFAYRGRVLADTVGSNLNQLQDEDGKSTPEELKSIGEESQDIISEAKELRQEVRMLLKPSDIATPEVGAISPNSVPTL